MRKGVTVFGSYITDFMARVKTLPLPGETVKGDFFKMSTGGKGFNQAIAAKRAGANVAMVTKLGKDQFGDLALERFKNENMSTDYIFWDDKEPTGIALIMVAKDTGQNIISVVPGACSNITDEDIEKAKEIIFKNEFLLLQLETNVDAILKIIDIAYEKGTKIILNPAPVSPLPDDIYQKLYTITPNETEAEKLTGIKIETVEDARSASQYFHRKGLKNVIITLGDKGAYISTEDEKKWLASIKVNVVDTTGAGDAFNGGFVAGLAQGKNILQACEYAMVVAGLSVAKIGSSISMPTLKEINAYLGI
jgi:ribokinase